MDDLKPVIPVVVTYDMPPADNFQGKSATPLESADIPDHSHKQSMEMSYCDDASEANLSNRKCWENTSWVNPDVNHGELVDRHNTSSLLDASVEGTNSY